MIGSPTLSEPRPARLDPARDPRRIQLAQERRFYAVAAFLLVAITAYGFRQFLLHGKAAGGNPMTPQIVALVVVHGIMMLA